MTSIKTILRGVLAAVVLLASACTSGTLYQKVTPLEANEDLVEAIGAEFDPHFYSQNIVGRSDGPVDGDFAVIDGRVTLMGLQKFRVMILPQWYEPYNDNDDPFDTDMSAFKWNTVEMQSLLQVLELAQKNGMSVCLTIWGCTRLAAMVEEQYSDVKTSFLCDYDANRNWVCPPEDVDEFGENFAALVKYLIEEKGLTCVNEITPFNEPGGDIIDPVGYEKVCRALDSHFRRLGVRDKVRFNLSDNIDTHQYYLEACAENLADIADIFNSHTYIFGYETPNDTVLAWERNNVAISRRAGLKHIVGEFGSNQCVSASRQLDINTYLRGVLMIRHALNFFNAGACAVSYWGLIDQYYNFGAEYSSMQQLGLWRSVKEDYACDSTYTSISCDYECRPQYYSYALLAKNVRPGAEVHPIETGHDFAAATAFRNADGKWVYVIANQENEPLALDIACEGGATFDLISYREGSLPSDGSLIKPSGKASSRGGSLKLVAAPRSVLYCCEK